MSSINLFWILAGTVLVLLMACTFIGKAKKAAKGYKLIIDGDSVLVSDEELEDFSSDFEEKMKQDQ